MTSSAPDRPPSSGSSATSAAASQVPAAGESVPKHAASEGRPQRCAISTGAYRARLSSEYPT